MITKAQVYNKKIAEFINQVENPYNFLSKIEQLGVKMSGTIGIDSTYEWLIKISKAAGYTPVTHKFLNVKDTLKNIELIKNGKNDSCILVCAHYDSWIGKGVNDNGTGDFAVYQFAKLLKNINSKYSLRFIFFSGEELGYLGSYNYVENIKKNSVKVKYMLNFDQLGGTIGEDNSSVYCERDEKTTKKNLSSILTNKISTNYSLYTSLNPETGSAFLSDYVPFMDSGYVISGIYQYADYPYYHTSDDLLKYIELNSLKETVKGALAAIIYLAEVPDSALINVKTIESKEISVYTTDNTVNFENLKDYNYEIIDNYGKKIKEGIVINNKQILELFNFSTGIYYVVLHKNLKYLTKKIFLQR